MNPSQLLTHYVRSCTDVDALDLEPLPLPKGEWGVTVEGEDVEYSGSSSISPTTSGSRSVSSGSARRC